MIKISRRVSWIRSLAQSVVKYGVLSAMKKVIADKTPDLTTFQASELKIDFPTFFEFVGNLYIGSNVKQRAQLGENYLDGTEVVSVKGSHQLGLISQILKDHGANVIEFRYDLRNLKEISRAIRQADILLDGVQKGGEIEEASASNPRLIVAECDCDDPFSSMSAVARISMALAARERTGHGQRLIASDCLDYWRYLNRFGRINQ